MEIERRWLMDSFPDDKLPKHSEAMVEQGYLSTQPVVRIRRSRSAQAETYILCFKGKGTLAREEVEINLDQTTYQRLLALLPMAPVVKLFKTYRLPGGEVLECSLVDPGTDTSFYYAEVEFSTVEQARAFQPPQGLLGEEKTEDPEFSMGNYWRRKLARQTGK